MKKTLLFTLFSLFVLFIGRGDNLPSNFMGVVTNNYENYFMEMVGFTLPEGKESFYATEFPSDDGHLKWGTWAEDRYVGAWQYGSEEEGFYFLYKSYKPETGEWEVIGDGDGRIALTTARNAFDATFDYVTKRLYIISQSKLYYNDLTNTMFIEVGTLTGDIKPSGIACNKASELYAICQDGGPAYTPSAAKLYKVNKTTAEATFVGNLGINIAYYGQAATFDYHTDVLYYYGSSDNSNSTMKTYSINVATGVAAEVASLGGVGFVGLTSVFYTKNVPPGKANDLSLTVDAGDNNKINLSFTIPTVDFNGITSASATKAVIYEKNALGEFSIKETINPVAPGNKINKQYTVAGEGIYTYAVEIYTATDLSSGKVMKEISNILPITLPYYDSFSMQKPNVSISIADEGSIYYAPDNGIDNSPSVAFKKGADANQLIINSLPFKKGATYLFSFKAKTTQATQDRLRYKINGVTNYTYLNIPAGGNFQEFNIDYFIAQEDQEATFTLYKHAATDADIIYVDDFRVEEVSPGTVPGKMAVPTVAVAPLGEKKATVTVTTPSVDMAGNPLTNLKGIKIEYSSSVNKENNYGFKEFPTTDIGAELQLTVDIETSPASYYFFLTAYNDDGYCYDITRTTSSVFIGEESQPKAPANIKLESAEGGKVKVSWDPVVVGNSNGYIDPTLVTYSVSYYGVESVSSTPIVEYNITETEWTTPALQTGIYTFTLRSHYKETASSNASAVRTVNKGEESHIVVANTTGSSYSSNDYPFGAYFTYGATDASGLSQMTYSVEEMGGEPMYIDEIYLFVHQSSNREEKELSYQLSLGYKDELEFENTDDFVHKDQLQVVFDGTITFNNTISTVAIPIKGFYYDATKPLLVQLAKTLDGVSSIDTYVKTTTENRGIRVKSNTDDLTLVEDPEDYTAIPNNKALMKSVPSLVVNKVTDIATISGIVTAEETGLPIENASVKIASIAGNGEKPLDIELFTDADGEYEFGILPFNAYEVTITAAGYVDYVKVLDVSSVEDISLDVELEGANKIKVEGMVKNLNDDALAGVEVIISRSSEEIERTTTAAGGAFEFMVYGSTSYTLAFSKEGMVLLTEAVQVGNVDISLEPFVLHYNVYPVLSVEAVLNDNGTATVTWTASDPAPMNGYRVYRGTSDQEFEDFELLTSTPVSGTLFVDQSLADVEYGVFKYAVCTDWYGHDISEPILSTGIEKNMTVTVTVNVKTNGASPEGAWLELFNDNYSTISDTPDANGKAVFSNVRRAETYSLKVTLPYHNDLIMPNIVVNDDMTFDTDLMVELIAAPVLGETSSIENIIEINWTIADMVDPIGFKVYLDDMLVEEFDRWDEYYVFRDVEAGERVAGLKAVFISGESDMASKTFSVEGLVKPTYLNVKVTDSDAELTWSPGGFSDPEKYEVYLDGNLVKDDVTDIKYTFTSLPNADYKAGVVAVYQNGKSEEAEITFTIDNVKMEQISSLLAAYPNPTINGKFTLEISTASSMKIYDVKGMQLMSKEFASAGKYEVDLSARQPGIYFIQIFNNEESNTIKLIYKK